MDEKEQISFDNIDEKHPSFSNDYDIENIVNFLNLNPIKEECLENYIEEIENNISNIEIFTELLFESFLSENETEITYFNTFNDNLNDMLKTFSILKEKLKENGKL